MRYTTTTLSALSLGILLATTAAQAQTFPSKTVTIVVTAAAGGVSDVVARAVGQRLSEAWGQQVVIENKGGGAHIIGAQAVAKAPSLPTTPRRTSRPSPASCASTRR
jgi:tripartite-type tricarboxylate transporter receptor subunit TctC